MEQPQDQAKKTRKEVIATSCACCSLHGEREQSWNGAVRPGSPRRQRDGPGGHVTARAVAARPARRTLEARPPTPRDPWRPGGLAPCGTEKGWKHWAIVRKSETANHSFRWRSRSQTASGGWARSTTATWLPPSSPTRGESGNPVKRCWSPSSTFARRSIRWWSGCPTLRAFPSTEATGERGCVSTPSQAPVRNEAFLSGTREPCAARETDSGSLRNPARRAQVGVVLSSASCWLRRIRQHTPHTIGP
jgi:hypothetical protein